jgi:hypothetical protein
LSCALLGLWLLAWASPAAAQLGAPVTGQFSSAGQAGVIVLWEGTEEDPGHEAEAAALGGFTLLGSLSPGGAVVASLPLPWPPPTPRSPMFIVPNVPPGTYYVVVVKGLTTSTGLVSPGSWQRVVVPTPCTTPPLAPVNLTAFQDGTNNVTVRWMDASGSCLATSYELHAGYGPGLSNAGVFQFGGTAYIGPAPPNTYYLRVRARNAYGTSPFSSEIVFVVNPTSCIGPGAPRFLTATVLGNQVTLNWVAPQDPGSRPIAAYGLLAGTTPGSSTAAAITLVGTGTTFQTSAPSGTYYVRVRALNGCGGSFAWGAPSSEVTVVVP